MDLSSAVGHWSVAKTLGSRARVVRCFWGGPTRNWLRSRLKLGPPWGSGYARALCNKIVGGFQVPSTLLSNRTVVRSVVEARYVVRMNVYLRGDSEDLQIISPASWFADYAVLRNAGMLP